ncbi:hypothetical protein ACRRTK_020233 [Alexandromys fortis]
MEDFREKWMSEGQQYSNATLPSLSHLITQILHDITTPREHQAQSYKGMKERNASQSPSLPRTDD